MEIRIQYTGSLKKFTYTVAGLRVITNRRAEDLQRSGYFDGTVNIAFTCQQDPAGTVTEVSPGSSGKGSSWHRFVGEATGSAFLRNDGKAVVIPENETTPSDYGAQIRWCLPFASALQGKAMLHASAVRAGETVSAFIGASRAGKSTLANQLTSLGFFKAADDLLPCRVDDGRVWVPLPPDDNGTGTRTPLGAVYFLSHTGNPKQLRCIPLSKKSTFQKLIVNGFGELASPQVWATQFSFYHQLTENTPAYELVLPDDRSRLPESARIFAEEILAGGRRTVRGKDQRMGPGEGQPLRA